MIRISTKIPKHAIVEFKQKKNDYGTRRIESQLERTR